MSDGFSGGFFFYIKELTFILIDKIHNVNITKNSILSIFGCVCGIIGAYFVSHYISLGANIIWIPGNLVLLYHSIRIRQWPYMIMFIWYLYYAIAGVFRYYSIWGYT